MEGYCRRVIADICGCHPERVKVIIPPRVNGAIMLKYYFEPPRSSLEPSIDELHARVNADLDGVGSIFRKRLEPVMGGHIRDHDVVLE